jgi:lipopolysaccharide export system protein LptA
MRTFFIFCVALGAGGFLKAQTNSPSAQTSPPSAQAESPALVGTATNGSTEIRSDNGGEFYYKLKTYIYRGNVRVDDPRMKLRCELLTVESPEMKEGKFNRATAETNVVIDWVDENGTNHATAAKAVYTYVLTNLATLPEQRLQTNAIVVLTGNPVVTSQRGVIKWDPIIWDRIKDVIYSTNLLDMKINADKTNTSGLFDMELPKDNKPAAK